MAVTTADLTNELKELLLYRWVAQREIAALQQEIADLKAENAELKAQLPQPESMPRAVAV